MWNITKDLLGLVTYVVVTPATLAADLALNIGRAATAHPDAGLKERIEMLGNATITEYASRKLTHHED